MCFVAQGHTSLTTDTIDVDGSSNLHRLCKLRLFNLLPAINLKETHRLLKMTVSMSKSSLGIKPMLFFFFLFAQLTSLLVTKLESPIRWFNSCVTLSLDVMSIVTEFVLTPCLESTEIVTKISCSGGRELHQRAL